MAATKKTSKAAAAKAEVEPEKSEAKMLEWQGLTLALPDVLPESVMFDVVESEATENGFAILRTLRSILGGKQFTAVRYKLEELGEDADSISLYEGIFGQYGLGLGESGASQDS